jgi:hypothetical protein
VTDTLALVQQLGAHAHATKQGYLDYLETKKGSEWRAFDRVLKQLQVSLTTNIPELGPIVRGGRALVAQDLTHITDGMTAHGSVWPALDDGVGHPGLVVIAPEDVTVTGHGRAKRRDGRPDGVSINIAAGGSKLEYWIGHLQDPVAVGSRVKKGQRLASISPNHEAPHVHVGINAVALIGHDLAHHSDYTHGAPLIGVQLAQAMV